MYYYNCYHALSYLSDPLCVGGTLGVFIVVLLGYNFFPGQWLDFLQSRHEETARVLVVWKNSNAVKEAKENIIMI